ncbi:hypothetical protein [Mycoplasmopsis adleri]|uniref:hypothetical protein n=1 Tax=Mycoplasmopsis adleri TaxID=51362 RepID=UPI003872B101
MKNTNIMQDPTIKEEKKKRRIKLGIGIGVPIAAVTIATLVTVGSYYSSKKYYVTNANTTNLNNAFLATVPYNWNQDFLNNENASPNMQPVSNLMNLTKSNENAGLNIFIFKLLEDYKSNTQDTFIKDLVELSLIADTPVKVYIEEEKNDSTSLDKSVIDKYNSLIKNKKMSTETIQAESEKLSSVSYIKEKYFIGIRKIVDEIRKLIEANADRKINIWVPSFMLSSDTALLELYGYGNVKLLGVGTNNSVLQSNKEKFEPIIKDINFKSALDIDDLITYLNKNKNYSYISLSTLYPNMFFFFNDLKGVKEYRESYKNLSRFFAYNSSEQTYSFLSELALKKYFVENKNDPKNPTEESITNSSLWTDVKSALNIK